MRWPLPVVPTESEKPTKRTAFVDGCIVQSIVMVLAGGILDGGQLFQVCFYAWVAFWAGVIVHVIRHGGRPPQSKLHDFLMRYGHFLLCVLSYFITGLIWKWRGYDYLFGN
jgi:hypothetical protein